MITDSKKLQLLKNKESRCLQKRETINRHLALLNSRRSSNDWEIEKTRNEIRKLENQQE